MDYDSEVLTHKANYGLRQFECRIFWVRNSFDMFAALLVDGFLFLILEVNVSQEKQLISLKREAKLKGGFYVEPEPKLMFVIRIRG